jgi:hypothetical protein
MGGAREAQLGPLKDTMVSVQVRRQRDQVLVEKRKLGIGLAGHRGFLLQFEKGAGSRVCAASAPV